MRRFDAATATQSTRGPVVKSRTASCCCGDLSITVSGEPERVIACHCDYCQKRTGNVFQVSCWYFGEQIESRTGEPQIFNQGPNNPGIDYSFCQRCGSTVYWEFTVMKKALDISLYGIAVGCFVDADFPAPDLEVYGRYRHHWIAALPGINVYDGMAPQERLLPKQP
jgi:hypothetical protein